jgi:hypothetical protein
MPMHNPPHPGEFIREVYLEPNDITGRQLAAKLGVSPSTLNRVLQGTSPLPSPILRSQPNWRIFSDVRSDLWLIGVDLGGCEPFEWVMPPCHRLFTPIFTLSAARKA